MCELNLVTLQCVTVKVLSILLVTFFALLCRRSLRIPEESLFWGKHACSLFTTSLRMKKGVICAVKTFFSRVIVPEKSNLWISCQLYRTVLSQSARLIACSHRCRLFFLNGWDPAGILKNLTPELVRFSQSTTQQVGILSWREILWLTHNSMGWNELSDPDMRTANFEFSCDVYREGVYTINLSGKSISSLQILFKTYSIKHWRKHWNQWKSQIKITGWS